MRFLPYTNTFAEFILESLGKQILRILLTINPSCSICKPFLSLLALKPDTLAIEKKSSSNFV
jgi:hypothetical protein